MIERLNKPSKILVFTLSIIGIILSINKMFYLNILGFSPVKNTYLYYILACFMPIAFLIFPHKKKQSLSVKWFDVLFFVLSLIVLIYFGVHGEQILLEGWDWSAPLVAIIFSVILWGLILEALRRTGGLVLSIMCLIISLYPLISSYIPVSFLRGQSYDFLELASTHIMGSESVIGIPFDTVGNLILGFLVFGVVLTFTGGGEFFLKLAQSLFGKSRGGEAKVSVVGSAFFGMLSGSAVSNTITSGAMTIPAMKKAGYKPNYAAAIEATSSTGGTITPPIMGSAAFIMASFIGVPYVDIILAAAVPAFLFYVVLLVQVDGYAARNKLSGIPQSKIPSMLETLKNGWFYLIALILLVLFIAILNSEGQAPYYASLALLIVAMIKKETRLNGQKFFRMVMNIAKVISELVCIIAGVGFIVGALSATGVSFSFSRELVALAGDNLLLVLVAGAITSFILGMGMTVSAVYIFLAIVMAPAIVDSGVNPIAAHLFVVYWASVSYITPPVALAAFTASGIANSNPLKTGFIAMRLGVVAFLIPFFFVYQPALIFQGSIVSIISVILMSILGVGILGSALEGYLVGIGKMNITLRIVTFILGICIFIPNIITELVGIIGILLVFLARFIINFKKKEIRKGEELIEGQ